MKKLLTLVLCLFALNSVFGQSTVNYVFSTATGTTLADMSSGTTQLVAGPNDDVASSLANIGFPFYFMGVPYTQFSVNSNGQMRLGSTIISGTNVSSAAASSSFIVPISGDNYILSTGKVHYKVTGTSPNQILVVEWKDLRIPYATSGIGSMVQAWLYEGTGKIEFRFGFVSNNTSTTTTRATFISSSNTANTVKYIGTDMISAVDGLSVSTYTMTDPNTALLNTRIYTFTPLSIIPADPTSLTFTAVTETTITPNWVDNSTDETLFTITRATDAAFTQNVVISTVASTTTATTGTAYSIAQTGLTAGTLFYYKIQAATEGNGSAGITGSQATLDATTYYWVGTTGGLWNTAANWNTAADGTGSPRTTVLTSDVLIVDGDGITPGGATTISVDLASFSIGQFKVTSNTACTLQSSSTTTRTITITGAPGDDFVIENGSTLNLTNGTNAVAFAFSGGSNTGTIAGTYNASSSTSNTINTTGGTGTLVTVAPTGVINNSILGSSGCMLGSVATLVFSNGSSYTHSGFTSSNGFIPLATWGATSNVTIAGGTTSTAITNAPGQTFGNFTYNSTTSTGTMSAFTSNNATVIQGNLTVLASNTGKLRIVTSGNLTINGNLVISGGTAEVSNNTGTVNVLGNVNVNGGTFDIAFASSPTLKVAGNFIQTAGNINQTSANGVLEFNGTSLQTLTLIPGSHGTNAINAKINNTAGVDLTSAFSIRNLTVTKGNLTGAGALTYNGTTSLLTYNSATGNQTANSFEFPSSNGPSSITINNTSVLPNNIVTIPFSRTLAGTSGVLTLTAGILDNTGYVLSIPNTAVGAVSGGSAASFVKGAIARDLPASLVTGFYYVLPVGKSGYNPFALVDAITNAGGTVTVQAEVFDADCGGTPASLIGSLHTNRYWTASITNGIGNFTNSLIQLNDSTKGADAVAASATQTGTYDIVGGTAITATATSLTTTAPASTTLPGFFVMGNKAAATLSNLAITPAGNLCTNVARTVTVTVTPGGGAVTGVVIDYSINGVAQTAITMTNTSGNDWSGVIPTVTPANANVAWSVTATDANLLTKTAVGTPYKDEPLFGATATANASITTLCSGNPTILNAVLSKSGNITIGTESTLTGATSQPTAFCNRWSSYRMQTVYTAAELIAAGLSAGPITAISYNISTLGDGATNANYTVKMGTTALTSFTDFISNAGFTTVYPAALYTHALGWNTITFTTPYNWDGISNLVIEVSHDGANATYNAQTYYTATSGNTVAYSTNGGTTGTLSTSRLNIIISGNAAPIPSAYSWSDGTTVVGTTNPLTVNPTSNTNYTCTITVSGCDITSNTISVTANPLPSTPTANNSSQCGTAVPACSVTSTSGAPSPIFNWYLVPTGGTPIAGVTGNTYTGAPISATTIFYVAEFDGTCESVRAEVTATVGAAPALTITPSQTVCNNSVATLTVTSTLTDFDNYTWSPVDDLYTDAACTVPYVASTNYSTVYVKSATGVTKTYTCNSLNTGTLCTNIATTDVTTLPAGSQTVLIDGNDFCLSGSAVLSATPTTGYGSATFQWQNSTDNITFNDIPGATALDYTTPTLTSTTYYKILVKLGATVCSESDVATVIVKNPQILSTAPGSRCGIGTVVLGATGSLGANLNWYAAATGGSSLGSGTSFTTPVISSTTDYYVGAETYAQVNIAVGAGALTSSGSYVSPFYHLYGGVKSQFLIQASELTASGLVAGNLTALSFDITSAGTSYNAFNLSIGSTSVTALSSTFEGGLTNVYSAPSVTPTSGIYTIAFAIPYFWDGSSNIIVETCWSNNNGGGTAANLKYDNTSFVATSYQRADNADPAVLCASTSTYGTLSQRPQIIFEGQGICSGPRTIVTASVSTPPAITVTATPNVICTGASTTLDASSSNTGYTYSWTPATIPATGASVSASPVSTTVYTLNAVDNSGGAFDGCVTIGTVNVTVNPVPTAVTATASSNTICEGNSVDLFSSAISGTTSLATILTESFENAGAIPAGWGTDLDVDGNSTNAALTFETASLHPTGFSAFDGSYFVRFNSYTVQSGNSARLKQTTSFSTVGYTSLTVNFAWTQDNGYTNNDNVVVQYSTDGVTWTTAGSSITRAGLTNTWTTQSVNLPVAAENQGTLYIAFLFTSAYGNDCHLDNVIINGQAQVPATFAWTSNPAGFTSTDQNPVGVVPPAVGSIEYIVAASNSLGCSTTASTTVVVDPCTGIENNDGINVSIVPNPSNGMFYLNVEGINETVTLNIYTINGKVIYSEQVDNTGLINKPIDLKSYPKGMYFLRLINNNMTHTEKIIIE